MPNHLLEFPVVDLLETNVRKDPSAVRPLTDGLPANAATFNTPTEILRRRTESLRTAVEDLKYLSDADRAVLLSSTAALSWSIDATTGLGKLSLPATASIYVRPFVAPKTSKYAYAILGGDASNYVKLAASDLSKPGAVRVYGRLTDSSHPGAHGITVKVTVSSLTSGTAAPTVDVLEDDTFINVTANSAAGKVTTLQDLADALNASSAVVALGLVATVVGTATTPVASKARTALVGGIDPELHRITAEGLNNFFALSGNEANALADGDCLAIWYETLAQSTTAGGRRQSLSDGPESRANTQGTKVDLNLTNLSRYPERVANAIPLCTREGDFVVFLDGTRIRAGESATLGASLEQDGGVITGNVTVEGTVTTTGAITAPAVEAPVVKATTTLTAADATVTDKLSVGVSPPTDGKLNVGGLLSGTLANFTGNLRAATLEVTGLSTLYSLTTNASGYATFNGAVNINNGFTVTAGTATFQTLPQFNAGLAVTTGSTETQALTVRGTFAVTATASSASILCGLGVSGAMSATKGLVVTDQSGLVNTTAVLRVFAQARTAGNLQEWANNDTGAPTLASVDYTGKLTAVSISTPALSATTGTFSGQVTSTVPDTGAAGTPPFVIASTAKVLNLNVDRLDGYDWTGPGAIGSVTPNTAKFTTLTLTGDLATAVNGTFTGLLTSNTALISTTSTTSTVLTVKSTATTGTQLLQTWGNSSTAVASIDRTGQITGLSLTVTAGVSAGSLSAGATGTVSGGTISGTNVSATEKVSGASVEATGNLKGATLTVNGATTKVMRTIAHCNAMITPYIVKLNNVVSIGTNAPSVDSSGAYLYFNEAGLYLVRLEGYASFPEIDYPQLTIGNAAQTPGATYTPQSTSVLLPRVFNSNDSVALSRTCYVRVPDDDDMGSVQVSLSGAGTPTPSAVLTVEYISA